MFVGNFPPAKKEPQGFKPPRPHLPRVGGVPVINRRPRQGHRLIHTTGIGVLPSGSLSRDRMR